MTQEESAAVSIDNAPQRVLQGLDFSELIHDREFVLAGKAENLPRPAIVKAVMNVKTS